MTVRAVTVWVKAQYSREFEAATRENHEGSIREPGVLRFDVLKSADRAGEYLLYEVYASDDAVDAHKLTAHYLKWRSAVEPLMEKPRVGNGYSVIVPTGEDNWRSPD